MKRNVAIALFAIIAIAAIGFVVFGKSNKNANTNPSAPTSIVGTQSSDGNSVKKYTASDVAQHSSENDCWTIVSGGVYDITSYIPKHPGGREILQACGTDATQLFSGTSSSGRGRAHSSQAANILGQYKIGALE